MLVGNPLSSWISRLQKPSTSALHLNQAASVYYSFGPLTLLLVVLYFAFLSHGSDQIFVHIRVTKKSPKLANGSCATLSRRKGNRKPRPQIVLLCMQRGAVPLQADRTKTTIHPARPGYRIRIYTTDRKLAKQDDETKDIYRNGCAPNERDGLRRAFPPILSPHPSPHERTAQP